MEYKVVLTKQAEAHFRQIIHYLIYKLESPQAATNVTNDFEETIGRLSHLAGSLKLCDDAVLRDRGYRIIHFQRHKYRMVYRINGVKVYIEGIYHDLQDYENILR